MSITFATLRRCLRLQVVDDPACSFEATPFGRALLKGEDRWGADDRMLYWVRLPSWRWMPNWITRRNCWHQAVLYWHGQTGFEVRWDAEWPE